MGLTSILLIALAVGVVFLMYRVGRGSRETAHARVAGSIQDPDGQGPVGVSREDDERSLAGHGRAGEDQGGGRHGCC